MILRFLLLIVSIYTFSDYSHAQAFNIVSKFDNKLTKYYKVDTCRVYENVNNGQQTVQYLRKLYLFNSEGLVSQEVEFGQSEYDGHTITKYSYDSYQNIIRKQILRPEREPIIYDYYYVDKKWERMTVNYPVHKEYTIQTTDNGLVIGILVRSLTPKIDPLTGEFMGKDTFAVTEEYEYRYNRHYKVVKENYYYMSKDMHTIVYQFSPNGFGPPLNMSMFKPQEKTPVYTTTYSYDPTGFLHMEVTKDTDNGYTNTLEYEYAYAWDSPLHQNRPELQKEQKFWIGKKKK